jgi:FlaA1/EpsC-like NDP-sugar epimerase
MISKIPYFKNTNMFYYVPSSNIMPLLVVIFFVPFLEESIFRNTINQILKYFLSSHTSNIITSLIFGLSHSTNYFVNKTDISNKLHLFCSVNIQMIMTTILGYLLSSNNCIIQSIIYHMYYNYVCLLSVIIYASFLQKDEKEEKKEKKTYEIYLPKRRYSYPNLQTKHFNGQYKIVSKETYELQKSMKLKNDLFF